MQQMVAIFSIFNSYASQEADFLILNYRGQILSLIANKLPFDLPFYYSPFFFGLGSMAIKKTKTFLFISFIYEIVSVPWYYWKQKIVESIKLAIDRSQYIYIYIYIYYIYMCIYISIYKSVIQPVSQPVSQSVSNFYLKKKKFFLKQK